MAQSGHWTGHSPLSLMARGWIYRPHCLGHGLSAISGGELRVARPASPSPLHYGQREGEAAADGIGVFKGGPLPTRLVSWGTAAEVLGGEHVATRAMVVITITGSSAMPSLQSMNGRVGASVSR